MSNGASITHIKGRAMLEHKNIAVLGCGDIGQRLLARLPQGWKGLALSRNEKPVPPGCEWAYGDARKVESYSAQLTELDALVITLTPGARSDEAYKQAYVEPVLAMIEVCKKLPTPPLLVFVSSTAVYAQSAGEQVNEASVCQPVAFNGQRMRETELLLQASGLPHCCVRFSGIYGSGRTRLLKSLYEELRDCGGRLEPSAGDFNVGNRIHSDDCARALLHILQLDPARRSSVYVASDQEPVRRWEMKTFLAKRYFPELSISELSISESSIPKSGEVGAERLNSSRGKYCDSSLLQATGFEFQYPSFRESYPALLDEIL